MAGAGLLGRRRGEFRISAPIVVGALLSMPLLVAAARSLVNGWNSPAGDVSLIELRVHDVGTSHTPLLGSYGRYGFNHPGPLWFVVLALPYRLTGNLLVGVLLVGMASIAAIVWVAARRGGLWLAGALTGLLVWGAGPAYLSDPWEPHGLLLPCTALLLLTFDTAAGRSKSLPLVAALASLVGAAQATLLPFAVAMGAVAVIAVVRAGDRRPLIIAGSVAAVLWMPTLIQQFSGNPPNVSAMWAARSSPEPSLGLAKAWDTVGVELGHRAPWLGFSMPLDGLSPTVRTNAAPLIPLGLLALLAALWRSRHPLVVTALVAVAAAVVAMSQLLGPVFVWIPEWLRVVGFGAWLAVGWVIVDRIPRALCATVLAFLSLVSVVDAATFDREPDYLGDAIRTLVDRTDGIRAPVLVESQTDIPLVFAGENVGVEVVVLEFEKRGIETVVSESRADHVGPRRAEPERAVTSVCLRSVDVGGIDPLPASVRAERERLLDELGLPRDASVSDILRRAQEDPARRDVADKVRRIPDFPRLDLVRGACA